MKETYIYGPDHPRSRGVYTSLDRSLDAGEGSSPLARGLLVEPVTTTVTSGIIPARAGSTRTAASPERCLWDHPRSRGVYIALRFSLTMRWGSSPLARGLQR